MREHERIATPTQLETPRAWVLAAAASATNFVAFGVLFSFGVFLTPIAETFDTTTGPVAPLFSGSVAVYYIAGAIGGYVADRRGVRPVIGVGAICLVLGLALASRASALWQLYVVYVPLLGVGVGSCYSPLLGAVGRRFEARRSMALAIVLSGVAAGTLFVPSIARRINDAHDWRTTFLVLAAAAAVILGFTALIASGPASLAPGGSSAVSIALGSTGFRWLYLSELLLAPGFFAPIAFFNDYAVDQGIGGGPAAALIGISGGSSIAARLLFGTVGDRLGALRQYQVSYVTMTAALIVWFAAGGSYGLLVLSALLHGIGWAAWVTATPMVLADWFGVEQLGGLLGIFYTGLGLGALVGPAVSGFVIDRADYRIAVALVTVTSIVATAVTFSSRPSTGSVLGDGRGGRESR